MSNIFFPQNAMHVLAVIVIVVLHFCIIIMLTFDTIRNNCIQIFLSYEIYLVLPAF